MSRDWMSSSWCPGTELGLGTKEKGAWKRGKQVSEKNFTILSPILAHALGTLGGLERPCAR